MDNKHSLLALAGQVLEAAGKHPPPTHLPPMKPSALFRAGGQGGLPFLGNLSVAFRARPWGPAFLLSRGLPREGELGNMA